VADSSATTSHCTSVLMEGAWQCGVPGHRAPPAAPHCSRPHRYPWPPFFAQVWSRRACSTPAPGRSP